MKPLPSFLNKKSFGKNKIISVQVVDMIDTVDSLTTKQNAAVMTVIVLLGPTSFELTLLLLALNFSLNNILFLNLQA